MPIPPPDWVSLGANKTQGLDLLGLRAPVQAIGNNLLNGLTSVTPKPRYLSVLAWTIWRYAQARLPDSWPDFVRFAAAQEAAIVMANLVHDRDTLRLIGVGKARSLVDSKRRTLPLEPLVRNIAFNIYASASLQLHLTFEKPDTGIYGLSKERGLPLAMAFDEIMGRTCYGSRLAKRRQFTSIARREIEELGRNMCLDQLPKREKSILIGAIFPASPVDGAEQRRIATLALLLWLSAKRRSSISQADLFDAACEPPTGIPTVFSAALDGWLDYQIRDTLAVAHETTMDAVMARVDNLSARNRAPAPSSDVIAALLGETDEHNEALHKIGLLTKGESVRRMRFKEMFNRMRTACQQRQAFQNGLRRWSGGLSESQLCRIALSAGAGAAALLPVAWCLAAYRITSEDRRGTVLRSVAAIGDFFQIGLSAVVLPKLDEFVRTDKTYLQVMAELISRTVQQHLRVAWQRFAVQGQDVSILVADQDTWGRNNFFRAGQTESRLEIAISWLHQLDLIEDDGLTAEGLRVLKAALTTLQAAAP